MRQTRIERKPRKHRVDRSASLSLDPRDEDVVRAKRLLDLSNKYRRS